MICDAVLGDFVQVRVSEVPVGDVLEAGVGG
jgi:hypothetical protein